METVRSCKTCKYGDAVPAGRICEDCLSVGNRWEYPEWVDKNPTNAPTPYHSDSPLAPVMRGYADNEIGHQQAKDTQVGGSHYQLPIQPIDYIVKNNIPYREANVIKYVTRHQSKNGIEDIRKAQHYLQMIIDSYVAGEMD